MIPKQKFYSFNGRSRKALVWPGGEVFADMFHESLCTDSLGKFSTFAYFRSLDPNVQTPFLYKESSLTAANLNVDCLGMGVRTQRPYALFFTHDDFGSFVFENLRGINGRCIPARFNPALCVDVAKKAISLLARLHWSFPGFGILHGDAHLANFVLPGVASSPSEDFDLAVVDFDQSEKFSSSQRRFAPFERDIKKLEEDCSTNLSLTSITSDEIVASAYLPHVPSNLRSEVDSTLRNALDISRRTCTWGI